ncbi:MAG: adenylyl-sulfate kinase [Alphaproteobacteria bacterium]|jgi:bifunctional enzyme CysN/CysC|nr:adenylyl-sulfate kinase [Alphaproteobacteria bacterium]
MDRERSRAPRRATNVQRVAHEVSIEARTKRNGHDGGVVWLTGLSGAGKSTLAVGLERQLFELGYQVYVLDGDNIRHGLCADLGFSPDDRTENIRRIGELAALMARAGMIVITAFISPYRSDRALARAAAGERFHEIFVKADIEVCEARDPKGLYKKARAGVIPDFTGISAPYEAPEAPDFVVDTDALDADAAVGSLVAYATLNFSLASRVRGTGR